MDVEAKQVCVMRKNIKVVQTGEGGLEVEEERDCRRRGR